MTCVAQVAAADGLSDQNGSRPRQIVERQASTWKEATDVEHNLAIANIGSTATAAKKQDTGMQLNT